jgi:peptidoglycan/LPS O-acetylase OafA/YrhL
MSEYAYLFLLFLFLLKTVCYQIMGYLPMHALVLLLFSPMFLYADVNTFGWPNAIWNGIMSFTLTQAWLPMHAEVWNAPTWYLSSLTFSTATLPFVLPKISGMDKRGLRRTAAWLMIVRILPVLGYCHDHNVWHLVEGMTAPKYHPALAVFNGLRFGPLMNTAEILLGCVMCRLAMMDSYEDKNEKPVKTNWLSTAVPMAGLIGILAGRANGIIPDMSDMLVRTVLFTPLFLKLVMAMHRNAVSGAKDPISDFLSSKAMVYMGALSFPIFVVHGPLGQVFYKRIIAGKLFGKVLMGPQNFGLFLGSVLVSAWLLQKLFLENKAVQKWSNTRVEKWSAWM